LIAKEEYVMAQGMDFEKRLTELEKKIEEFKSFTADKRINMQDEIVKLELKADQLRKEIYSSLTPWQIVQISRHLERPHTLDYIRGIFDRFIELHGDRAFIDDRAMVGGIAWMQDKPYVVFGTQKGKDTKENIEHNFGLALPEGYRKALRLMKLAEKFKIPVVSFIDTGGAFPGMEGEERGVAEAIARNLREMSILRVPIVVIVIGEGGSGGALGIGVGDRVAMLSNASYTVITPEGCAAILWKDRSKAETASEILKLTAKHLKEFGVIDSIIDEPEGGAHREPAVMLQRVKEYVLQTVSELLLIPTDQLLNDRYMKFRKIGAFQEASRDSSPGNPNGSKKKQHNALDAEQSQTPSKNNGQGNGQDGEWKQFLKASGFQSFSSAAPK
jgi:acetyl-CoA carboxylase carboxyl transferase subunit alpha